MCSHLTHPLATTLFLRRITTYYDVQHVRYHTIDLVMDKPFEIQKPCWDLIFMERLAMAADIRCVVIILLECTFYMMPLYVTMCTPIYTRYIYIYTTCIHHTSKYNTPNKPICTILNTIHNTAPRPTSPHWSCTPASRTSV